METILTQEMDTYIDISKRVSQFSDGSKEEVKLLAFSVNQLSNKGG